jgi:hypothetical protein
MVSLYIDNIFGKRVHKGEISFEPFITEKIRNTVFKFSNELILRDLDFLGKKISVKINLPNARANWDESAYYLIQEVKLNGKKIGKGASVAATNLVNGSYFEITLDKIKLSKDRINLFKKTRNLVLKNISNNEVERFYSPKTPELFQITSDYGKPSLSFKVNSAKNIGLNVFRNGALIASGLKGNSYVDKSYTGENTACYTVEAQFLSSGNRSHHSEAHCFWKAGDITTENIVGNYNTDSFKPKKSGHYGLQLSYNNFGHLGTGITAAVKKLDVIINDNAEIDMSGVFAMPHHGRNQYWVDSNFIRVYLEKGISYHFRVSDFYNMSYFTHFENYLHLGGESGPYNHANLSKIKILYLGPAL